MTIISHTLGFPRIGLHRELKKALEQYWNEEINQSELFNIGATLRKRHWKQQIDSGINLIPVGDFAWYDHVLTTSLMLDNIPDRYRINYNQNNTMEVLFKIARGYSTNTHTIAPSEMKKWFNTNYHYIVPEFVQGQKFKLNWTQLFEEIDEALSLGYSIKPILLGPISYLWLGKAQGKKFDKLSLLPSLLSVYKKILNILSKKNIEWIQIDEPILILELPKTWIESYYNVYQELYGTVKLLLTTYFDGIYHQLDTIKQLKINGLHVDLVSSPDDISLLHEKLPKNWILSAGVINGKNIWKTNLYNWFNKLYPFSKKRTLWIGSSCSLLHSPIDINSELNLNQNIKSWFSFALQKCSEISILCSALNSAQNNHCMNQTNLKEYYSNNNTLHNNLINDFQVQERCKNAHNIKNIRNSSNSIRSKLQNKRFNLPLYPITTIGSFPQTQEIRNLRLNFKNGKISTDHYNKEIKKYIKYIISEQEKLDLDVLVHGEPERNDMVEYFGENLKGFISTQNGWIQSYGSRCVKPPIIIGDISRKQPITKKWINYAQSLTTKPIKGILTGPITIMLWSFTREDIQSNAIALQLALAIRDEVIDLEKSGIGIIQIDEPALREGLPLKKSKQSEYLKWAIHSFKVATSSVQDHTQIHTHMCYSEFKDIMNDLLKLDVDVISIEASRSNLKLLESMKDIITNTSGIGPGIYDIHSKNIPNINDLINKITQFLKYIPKHKLWINPDCGLKTRSWSEIKYAMYNIVQSTKILRNKK